jgi:hypothetical protein
MYRAEIGYFSGLSEAKKLVVSSKTSFCARYLASLHTRPDQALSVLYSLFWRLTAHAHRTMRGVSGPDQAAVGETAWT